MPNLPHIHFTIYLLSAMHIVWFGLAGGWLIYHHREQHDHSRLYIGATFWFVALGCIQFIVTGMVRGDLNLFMNTLLEPYPSILFFLPALLPSLYVLEVMQSHWLTWKRFLALISPWIVLVIAWLIYHGMHHWEYSAITHIGHVGEIMPNMHKTDVLLRILLNAIYLPYPLLLVLVRYRWRICNVGYSRTVWLKLLVVLWAVFFVLGLHLRLHNVIILYFVLLDVISIYVFIIEKVYRIPVPQSEEPEPAPQPITIAPELSPLAQRLHQQLVLGICQNPDLDRDNVCQLLGTNRTYLSSAVQELGFTSFHDMINRQRVLYIHEELQQNPKAVLSDVIYRAGFRSRTTAINYFKQVYKCTPSDFANG